MIVVASLWKRNRAAAGATRFTNGPRQEVQKKQLEQDETGSGPQDPLGMTMVLLL